MLDVSCSNGDATVIGTLAGLAAALVAVALAILTVIPTFVREAQDRSGPHAGRRYVRQFRLFYWTLGTGVVVLVLGALTAVVGLFFPSHGLAIVIGTITALGILALSVGCIGIAILVGQSLGRIR